MPVAVSPTGNPVPLDRVASSVTVITSQEIEREQRRAVPRGLQQVPDLNVVQTGGPGGQTSVFVRGSNSNQVKVLIDGIEVSDPPTRSFEFGFYANPNLKPEESMGWDAGLEQPLFNARVRFGTVHFDNDFKNLINSVTIAPFTSTLQNVGRVSAYLAQTGAMSWALSTEAVVALGRLPHRSRFGRRHEPAQGPH